MPVRSVKYTILIIVAALLILSLFLVAWQNLAGGVTLGIIFLLFSLAATSYTVIKNHREAYLQGKASLRISIRNASLQITGILLAMVLAVLSIKLLAPIVSGYFSNDLIKVIVGICLGLLVGFMIGSLIQKGTSRLTNALPGR